MTAMTSAPLGPAALGAWEIKLTMLRLPVNLNASTLGREKAQPQLQE